MIFHLRLNKRIPFFVGIHIIGRSYPSLLFLHLCISHPPRTTMQTAPSISTAAWSVAILVFIIQSAATDAAAQGSLKKRFGLPVQSEKQILDFIPFRRTLYVVRTCPSSGACGDEVSETKPLVTVAHSVCHCQCYGATLCGSGRALGCETVRDPAGNWISTCKLARCFDKILFGAPNKCCHREACSKPPACTPVPAGPAPVIVFPVSADPTGTIDFGVVPVTANFVVKKCLKIPPVPEDIYLLTDATGSMGGLISIVKANLNNIITTRKASVDDLRFGVGIYRDELELSNGFQNLLSLSKDFAAVQSKVNSITATGGNDRDEAGLAALYKIATDGSFGWRSNAQKVVVLFGDEPQHEPTCVHGKVITRSDVIDALLAKDISVVTIDVRNLNAKPRNSFTCANTKPVETATPGNQMIDISSFTRGESRKTTSLAAVIATLNDALDNLKLQFFIDITNCSAAYDITFNILVPKAVMRGDTVCFDQRIKYTPDACKASVSKRCDVKFTASGPLLGTQTLDTQALQGCPL